MSSLFLLQNGLASLMYGGLLFLVSAGFTLIFGLMRVINIAQTAFYLIAAYVGLTLITHGMGFWPAVFAASLIVAGLGLIIYRLVLHRHHGNALTSLLLTIGVAFMLSDGALGIWGGNPESVAPPRMLASSVHLGSLIFPSYWLALIVISALIALALVLLQRRTILGAVIRAGVDDEEMARGMGLHVDRAFYIVFGLGAFLAGLGGMLGAPVTGAYPGLDMELLPLAFAVVIVGGLGSIEGAIIGSFVIGVLNTFGNALFPQFSYFTIFVPVAAIMAFRPQGLMGRPATDHPVPESGRPAAQLIARRGVVWVGAGVAVALLVALPAAGLPTYYVGLLSETFIYAIAAMALDVLLGFTGLVSFAQAAFFGAAAYVVAIVSTRYHLVAFGSTLMLAVLAVVVLAALFGVLALRGEGVPFIIITLALSEIVWGLANQWVNVTGGDNGLAGFTRPMIGPFHVTATGPFYYLCLIALIGCVFLLVALVRSPFGLTLVGVRDRPRRMRALGYNVWLIRYVVFIVAAMFTGLAGVLFGYYNTFVGTDDASLGTMVQLLIMVILGGRGTLVGPLLGSAIVVFVSNGLSNVTPRWETILGALYVIVLLWAPDGIVSLGARLWAAVTKGTRRPSVPAAGLPAVRDASPRK